MKHRLRDVTVRTEFPGTVYFCHRANAWLRRTGPTTTQIIATAEEAWRLRQEN